MGFPWLKFKSGKTYCIKKLFAHCFFAFFLVFINITHKPAKVFHRKRQARQYISWLSLMNYLTCFSPRNQGTTPSICHKRHGSPLFLYHPASGQGKDKKHCLLSLPCQILRTRDIVHLLLRSFL